MPLFLQGCGKEKETAVKQKQTEEITQVSLGDAEDEMTSEKEEDRQDNDRMDEPEAEHAWKDKENIESTEDAGVKESEIAYPSVSGSLRVEGTQLVDENGKAVQLRGISTHGLAWFPDYVNEECFRQFREEWNVNVIRLAMYTAETGGYCTGGDKDSLKQLIKDGVQYATNQDMYVIIDWHVLSDRNPNTYLQEAKDFFAEMSAEYADYDNVIYEICNEPNGGTGWKEIKSYAEEMIAVIRENDADGIILVGTPNWSQYVDQAAADPVTGYENIMYTLHFYAATHKDSLRQTMTAAIENGLPVFVSEYGICDASGSGAIDEKEAEKWINIMDAYGVSYVAWNLSNKNETSAILNSSCTKSSGFEKEDLSAAGKWLYEMLTGKNAGSGQPAASGTPAAGGTRGSGETPSGQKTASEAGVTLNGKTQDGVITCTVLLVNSWEADGKTFYQYDVSIKNDGEKACDGWTADISFSDKIALSDGWNGEYTVDETLLHIAPKDYNGSILAGESIGDIGFIVSGGATLRIVENQ